ncbi:MAG TPA: PH domain-containing protein [Mycobacteriales bacterium]|jgi:hypothetical protein|nr:PH domain-containing protein [Mycobacteriales bacterium]
MPRIEWRVPRRRPAVKLAGAFVFLAVALVYARDPGRWVTAVLAAVALGAFALRDVLAPVRLAADTTGVTVVHGFAGTRHIPWGEVERVRVDARGRLGRRDEVLEVDTGESLHLFGAQELGADLDTVAAALVALRTGNPIPGG